ncbi:MAG TPA: tetratricopeptide repeat protein, partial [Terriglobia bacterium]|nr:tetratricopeptide repeat protein [Terriglobia bacterium]
MAAFSHNLRRFGFFPHLSPVRPFSILACLAVLAAPFLLPRLARAQEPGPPADALQDTLKAATEAERANQYERAAGLYQQALASGDAGKLAPGAVIEARTRLATDYFLLRRYQDSLDALAPLDSPGSAAVPRPAQAWLVGGLDHLELGQIPEAEAAFRETLALNPDSGTARLALGDALARAGRMDEAAEQYEEQTRRTPTQSDAWYKL